MKIVTTCDILYAVIKMSDILFTNCNIMDGSLRWVTKLCVGVSSGKIDYVGEYRKGSVREYDCRGGILMPALCNAHAHSAMTLLRGIGEDMPLSDWLNGKIFPAEAKLTPEDCYTATLLACAEMMKYGTASCSDMYFFGIDAVRAYSDAGFKANFAPAILCFDDRSFEELPVYNDYVALVEYSQGSRLLKTDLGIHSTYCTTSKVIEGAVRYANDRKLGRHIHVSETAKEHAECIDKFGMTPTAYLEKYGVFDERTVLAHCVWISDDDREILRKHGVTVASCPESNLKLGSGICDYIALAKSTVVCALGTDGAASNNNLNMLKEARLAALLAKGTSHDASAFIAPDALWSAYRAGYISQGRYDSGYIKKDMCADLALYPADDINMTPNGDIATAMLYSSDGVAAMTMINGRIVYENGEYHTIDIEKVRADALQIRNRLNG